MSRHLKATVAAGDCREFLDALPAGSARACITSPPYYGLRDYGHPNQIGKERGVAAYIAALVDAFAKVHRVLADDGTLWLNLGDTYVTRPNGGIGQTSWACRSSHTEYRKAHGVRAGKRMKEVQLPHKSLMGIPWRVALALQDWGWILRQDIIWHKPNAMPEPVTDRCSKAHEYIFLFSKQERYFFNIEAMKEPAVSARPQGSVSGSKYNREAKQHRRMRGIHLLEGKEWETRNRRSVWSIPTQPLKDNHFAAFPMRLVSACVAAATKEGDTVLDPFTGSGTTGAAALAAGREFVGCEINPDYVKIARRRIAGSRDLFNTEWKK